MNPDRAGGRWRSMSYGPNPLEVYRDVVRVDEILTGAEPGDQGVFVH